MDIDMDTEIDIDMDKDRDTDNTSNCTNIYTGHYFLSPSGL